MFEKIAGVLADQLGIDAAGITMETDIIKDLNADSLDMVEMIMALEDEYGIEISEEDGAELATVGDVVEYLNAQGINE